MSLTSAVAIERLPCIFQLPATNFLRMVCFRCDQTASLPMGRSISKPSERLASMSWRGQE
jgi:hypothetical protein